MAIGVNQGRKRAGIYSFLTIGNPTSTQKFTSQWHRLWFRIPAWPIGGNSPDIDVIFIEFGKSKVRCWLLLLVTTTGYYYWLLLLVTTAGYHCWLLLLVTTAGHYCWLLLLVTTAGYYCWFSFVRIPRPHGPWSPVTIFHLPPSRRLYRRTSELHQLQKGLTCSLYSPQLLRELTRFFIRNQFLRNLYVDNRNI